MTLRLGAQANDVSSRRTVDLDEVDRRLLAVLLDDARVSNKALAARVGIAPSTCSLRVSRLVSTGVVRGFHADLDLAAVGLPIQAMIAVKLQPNARATIAEVAPRLASLPGVVHVYFLAGADDFLVQVASPSPDALSAFVIEHLSASKEFAGTQTSLVFDHVRGAGA